MSTSFVYLFVY
jgi:hypothetical protein